MRTVSQPDPTAILLTSADILPVVRSAREQAALRALLQAATAAEQAARGTSRRDAYRTNRSLIAASRALGFTLAELAAALGVSEGQVRSRSNVLTRVLPSSMLALVPVLIPAAVSAGLWRRPPLAEEPWDPRELIAWYLSAARSDPPTGPAAERVTLAPHLPGPLEPAIPSAVTPQRHRRPGHPHDRAQAPHGGPRRTTPAPAEARH